MVQMNAGKAEDIWTERSVGLTRLLLGTTYAVAVGLLALGLIGGCQGLKDSLSE